MELIDPKIYLEREIISHIQIYLTNLLSTQDVVYDVDGNVVNEINDSSYCKALRFSSERKERCHTYSRELSKSAIHFKKPFEDTCPGGLTILAMPIFFGEDAVIGAHCVAVSNPPRSKFSVYDVAKDFNIDAHILWDAVKKTPLIPKPILKIAREQVVLATELMSKVLTRIGTLRKSEATMAEKYHSIEEIIKSRKNE